MKINFKPDVFDHPDRCESEVNEKGYDMCFYLDDEECVLFNDATGYYKADDIILKSKTCRKFYNEAKINEKTI